MTRTQSTTLVLSSCRARNAFGKLDYCNRDLSAGSENPADPFQTCRALTIMLAEDY